MNGLWSVHSLTQMDLITRTAGWSGSGVGQHFVVGSCINISTASPGYKVDCFVLKKRKDFLTTQLASAVNHLLDPPLNVLSAVGKKVRHLECAVLMRNRN